MTAGSFPIEGGGLCRLIRLTCPQVQLAVLNSCWSGELALQLTAACGCAVGMTAPLPDRTGVAFAAELYQAIAFGHSVGQAVEMARAALELHGVHRPEIVQLLHRDGVDPNHVFVIPSWLRQPMSRAPKKPDEILTITRSSKRRFVAVVSGSDDSADGFISKLHAANIEDAQIQWITTTLDDERY